MNLDKYSYSKAETHREYYFHSEGPRGRIKKMVRFQSSYIERTRCYNLVLGDWLEDNSIDHLVVTNNGDTEKLLATVAAIVMDFTLLFEDAVIYTIGSTVTRTRRYQMSISKTLDEIEEIFNIYGYTKGQWEIFQKNINYDAFLVSRKEHLFLKEPNSIYMTEKNKQVKRYIQVQKDVPIYKEELIDGENDPYTQKKMKMMKEMLEKSPIPEALLRRQR
ncbi:MAG TPA: hypothetical protein VGM41_01905 [Chitinophagaceae bacterium]